MRTEDVSRAYRRYARIYDVLFGPVFEQGRRRAAELVTACGCRRILELGVGTGLSLGYYPAAAEVVGIDLSAEMLARARCRVDALGRRNVTLHCMDAAHMDLPDGSFDVVVCMYVVSVVPDLDAVMAEVRRVLAPGGTLVIVNHLAYRHPLVHMFEKFLARFGAWLGFRPDTSLERVEAAARMQRIAVRRIGPCGFWTLAQFRHETVPAGD